MKRDLRRCMEGMKTFITERHQGLHDHHRTPAFLVEALACQGWGSDSNSARNTNHDAGPKATP